MVAAGRPACHKPDLPSGFVKFMRIGETVYGAYIERGDGGARARAHAGKIQEKGARREVGVGRGGRGEEMPERT